MAKLSLGASTINYVMVKTVHKKLVWYQLKEANSDRVMLWASADKKVAKKYLRMKSGRRAARNRKLCGAALPTTHTVSCCDEF